MRLLNTSTPNCTTKSIQPMQNTRTHPLVRFILASMLLLGVGAFTTAQAQAPDAPPSSSTTEVDGSGFFAIGTQFTDLGPLNDQLSRAGYPEFTSETVSLGGGGYGVVANRLLLGGEGHALVTGDGTGRGRNVSLTGGYGFFNLGYLFVPTSSLRAYPLLGIDGGGLQLDIESPGDAGNFSDVFSDVLDTPNRSARMGQASFLISLGAGLEYQFGTPDEGGSVQLGERAGYIISALRSDWQLDENSLTGGPDASMRGPFVRLTIGGISFSGDDED